MRVLLLALSVLGIFIIANAANAGPSTTARELSASADPATSEEATQETEDRIGLDKRKRRDVQRRLTGSASTPGSTASSTNRPAP